MNQILIDARDAMHSPSGPAHAPHIPHLHIILTDPWEYEGSRKLIWVNITKMKPIAQHNDKTCIITQHDSAHPFITKNSFVLYQRASIVEESSIIKQINEGVIVREGTMASPVFKRVTDGLMRCRLTPPKVLEAYKHYISV